MFTLPCCAFISRQTNSPSPTAGGLDFGDVDLAHFHHRGEDVFRFSAASRQPVHQRARRDLPGDSPAVFAPAAHAGRESQRDSAPKPRVARHELPWVSVRKQFPTATRWRAWADGHQLRQERNLGRTPASKKSPAPAGRNMPLLTEL